MASPLHFLSPLRYPGSKRRLAKYIQQTLELNGLHPSLYVEPFVGGGSVALQLLHDNIIDKVVLMDIDPWVTSFWETVFFDTDWLIEKILTTEITLALWQEIKASVPVTKRDQAWACFFLNRTSFSGILEKKVGPIGGKEQKSIYKIDCRFSRDHLVDRVKQVAAYKDKIHAIWCITWIDGIKKLRKEQQENKLPSNNLFFYFDPPFFEQAESLYRYYFLLEDHICLRDFLLTLEEKWLLSYDSADQVFSLYGDALKKRTNGARHNQVEIFYSLSILLKRKKAKEIVLSNFELLPDQKK
jgi:DNA adenine methylase